MKKIEPPDDNLDEYFASSQDKNSQGTADVTPTETPKKSEGAKSKNDPKVPVTEGLTNHLEAQLVKVPRSLPLNRSNLHNR